MKKFVLLIAAFTIFNSLKAQDTLGRTNPTLKTVNLNHRPGDHLMLQFGYDGWSGMPDSVRNHQKGLNRGFNAYFMFDKVFKSSPKFSIGIGAGVSTSNIYFDKMNVVVNGRTNTLPFVAVDSTDHFKKYKVATTFLEIPLELRYTARPAQFNKSVKAALGIKLGTMVNAHTKGKNLLDKNNNPVKSYTEKITSKQYFNTTRFMATARVGYGIVSIFGTYGLSNVLKDGVGPEMKPFQVGITVSGL